MRGEILPIADELFQRVWEPLSANANDASEYWTELFQAIAKNFSEKTKWRISQLTDDDLSGKKFDRRSWLASRGYVEASIDSTIAEELLASIDPTYFESEREVVTSIEDFYMTCFEIGGDTLATRYFELFSDFIARFSLKYELRTPMHLCPSVAGLMTGLLAETSNAALASSNLAMIKREFDESIRDLRSGSSVSRIKTCISKHYMFIEALADEDSTDSGKTLGELLKKCDWPHQTLKAASGNLYGFRSDYPGIGHGTSSNGLLRDVDERDLVGLTCMIAGLAPYVSSRIDSRALVISTDSSGTIDRISAQRAPDLSEPPVQTKTFSASIKEVALTALRSLRIVK